MADGNTVIEVFPNGARSAFSMEARFGEVTAIDVERISNAHVRVEMFKRVIFMDIRGASKVELTLLYN